MAPIPEPWEDGEDKEKIRPLDEDDIQLLKTYGLGPYADAIRTVEQELKEKAQRVNDLCGAWKRKKKKRRRQRRRETNAKGGWERRTTRQNNRNEGRQEKKPPSDAIETETKHRRCVLRRSNHVAQADETHDRTRRNEQESRNPTRDSQHQANGTWSRTNKPCKKNNRCRCANGRSPKTDGNASKRSKCRANDERNHRTWKRNADDIHPTTTTTDAGREMHEDHRRQHGRSQVRHQRQTDRQGTCCRLRNE